MQNSKTKTVNVRGKTYEVEYVVRDWNPPPGFEHLVPDGQVCEMECPELNLSTWGDSEHRATMNTIYGIERILDRENGEQQT